ncbi:MAG: helix-turn-helix transcriptional regulator [Saprospiraceae bacterium]|nr:helix-turn-helix transcriptional regulator [Saprospiraceae bacterium]MCB0626509.1 helix-turn-helix transcriptional regulator [Saprospiraceae bacterium]MCB0676328.1 helix-turn-helix transcriptional regulator [Saprospiraceae bacterium]MCB0681156.1 helix-turn-helix transcriptional regulator [Saprospiraceae bacterium]
MILEIKIPPPPLGQVVDSITYHEGYSPAHAIERFLPDGSVDLVIDLTEEPKHIYDNQTLEQKQACRKAWVSGMRRHFISIDAGQNSSMLVVRLRPGAAWNLLQLPLAELTDQVVEAELLFGAAIVDLREQLLAAVDPPQKLAIAGHWLWDRLRNGREAPPVVGFAVQRLLADPTQQAIEELARKTGCSQKHLIQLFQTYVGLSPKYYQRLLRFQLVLEELQSSFACQWTRIAHDCGYYDQAHFINEFRRFSGFRPTEYLQEKEELAHYVPVRGG